MDHEVAKTLSELELKLQELERELTSLGHRGDTPLHRADTPDEQSNAPGRLIDEAVERERWREHAARESDPRERNARGSDPREHATRESDTREDNARESDPREHAAEEAPTDRDGFGGPAVWGGEEVPAQAGATIERDWTVEVRETAYGEIPIPPPQTPDVSQAPWPPVPASQQHAPPPPTHPFLHSPPHAEDDAIDIEDLELFRDRLTRVTSELADEYDRLLSSIRARRRSDS